MSEQENQTPTQPEYTDKFAFMNKLISVRMASFLFIVISVALLIGVISTSLLTKQLDVITEPLTTQLEAPQIDESTVQEWKTYTDYDYFFSIKYPTGWTFAIEDGTLGMKRTVSFFKEKQDISKPTISISVFDKDSYAQKLLTSPLSANNVYGMEKDSAFNYKLILPDGNEFTPELEKVHREVFKQMISSFSYDPPANLKDCKPTGCSGQICSDKEVMTTCVMLDAYKCYKDATCERQKNGSCGWTQTPELSACLNEASGVQGIEAPAN